MAYDLSLMHQPRFVSRMSVRGLVRHFGSNFGPTTARPAVPAPAPLPLDSKVLYLSLWRCRHTVVAVLHNRREKAVSETVRMLYKNQLIVLSVLPTCSKENSEAAPHHWIFTIPYASRKKT